MEDLIVDEIRTLNRLLAMLIIELRCRKSSDIPFDDDSWENELPHAEMAINLVRELQKGIISER